jgi:3'(2'), 5'-bisphosphate nucleotidase
LGRTIWGLLGLGAFGIQHKQPPEGEVIVTTTRSHSSQTVNKAVDAVNPDKVLRVGGAGHKVLLVIEGKAHAYVFASRGCKKWDTCAPQAILESVGGKLTDILGNELSYDKDVNHTNELGVLATHDSVKAHKFFCNKIPDDVKASLILNQRL